MSGKGQPPALPPRRRSRHSGRSSSSGAADAPPDWFTSYTKPAPAPAPRKPQQQVKLYREAFTKFPTLQSLHTKIGKRWHELGGLNLCPSTLSMPSWRYLEVEAPPFRSFVEILAMKEAEGLPLEDDPVSKLLPTSRMHRGKSMPFESARKRLQRRARKGTLSMGPAQVVALLWESSDSDVEVDDKDRESSVHSTRKHKGPRPESIRHIFDQVSDACLGDDSAAQPGESDATCSQSQRSQDDGSHESNDAEEDDDSDGGDEDDDDVQPRMSFFLRTDRHIMDLEPRPLVLPVSEPGLHETVEGTPRGSLNSDYRVDSVCSHDDDFEPTYLLGLNVGGTAAKAEQHEDQLKQETSLESAHPPQERDDGVTGETAQVAKPAKAGQDANANGFLVEDGSTTGELDPRRRESRLSFEEFVSVFGMSREEFYALPEWKQQLLKKEHNLF